MHPDPKTAVEHLLTALQAATDVPIPTTPFKRLRKTASTGLEVGLGALVGRLRGNPIALGTLTPEALARFVTSLGELKGIAMKAGQILSYVDGSLEPEARELLAVLQRHSQPTPFEAIRQTLEEDLGERGLSLAEQLEPTPVAAASIGQVHRARLSDGTTLAVKVRHPGIVEALEADFKSASIGKTLAALMVPGVNVQEFIEEAHTRFLEECDYLLEAERQSRFRQIYASHPFIRIPEVHGDLSSRRVLTSTWHSGLGLEAFLATSPSREVAEQVSRGLYEFYVGSLYRYGLFNADPHPGNLLFTPEGELTVLDHGCVRSFEPEDVGALVRLSFALQQDDVSSVQEALSALGMPHPADGYEVTRMLLRGFYAPLLEPGEHPIQKDRAVALGETIKLKKTLLKLNLPGKLMFLFRIRFGLYAVLARIGASLNWGELERQLAAFEAVGAS